MGGQSHASAALSPRKKNGTHCTGAWVGLKANLDRGGKSHFHQDSTPRPFSPQRIAVPVTIFRTAGTFVKRDKRTWNYQSRTWSIQYFLHFSWISIVASSTDKDVWNCDTSTHPVWHSQVRLYILALCRNHMYIYITWTKFMPMIPGVAGRVSTLTPISLQYNHLLLSR